MAASACFSSSSTAAAATSFGCSGCGCVSSSSSSSNRGLASSLSLSFRSPPRNLLFRELALRSACAPLRPRAQLEVDSLTHDPAPQMSIPPEGPKLYVGNLSWNCESDDLAEHFQGAGTVEMVEIIIDRETGRSRGFGFVTMSSMDEANEAISRFDGAEFMGRRLRVSFPDRSRNDGPRPRQDSNAHKLFVGNLPWGMDDLSLENLFTDYGKVLEAKVIYDRDSGRSRGFGFVTLSSVDEINEAISKMDGAEVQGRPLRVNLASDRPPPRQSFF